ncbi:MULTISPECIES: ferredoxin [Actinomadura]|uniref:ferredoxin n=1 Tax=Actinomadura TaxID=1988 RepID=UPI00262BB016|nr:ferredoxin [Actinomadura geliboluensis]
MRIDIDRDKCIGSGMCVLTEDTVFDQSDEDGRVLLLNERPGDDLADEVRYAVKWCPGRALTLIED